LAYWDGTVDFVPTVTIKICDVQKQIVYDSLQVSNSVSNRAQCDFDMIVSNKNEIKLGNHIDVFGYLNPLIENYIFAGRVTNIKIKPLVIGGELIASITAVDYNHVLDRELVVEEYVNKSIYYIVDDIYQKYLMDEWVAIYRYPSNNVIIQKAIFAYVSIADCFKYLCDETAYNYVMSADGWIDFFYRDDLTTEDMETSHILDIDIEYNLDDYRNRQFVKGGYDETTVTNEVLTPKPDGNTTTFFSRYPIGTVPTVKVDNVTVSAASVGIDGVDKDKWFYWNKSVNKLSQNTQLLSTLTTGTISMDYKGLVKIMVQADNVEGQTEMRDNETTLTVWGTGVYANIEEVGSIQTRDEAINYANGLLYKYNKIPESISIKSFVYRQTGRTIFINYPNMTDDQLFFIESVNTFLDNGRLRYNYKVLNGESLGNWTEFFRKVYKSKQDMLINEDVALIKLQQQVESWDICSEYNIGIYEPVYLSDSAYLGEDATIGIAIEGKQYYPVYLSDTEFLGDDIPIGIIQDNGYIVKDT